MARWFAVPFWYCLLMAQDSSSTGPGKWVSLFDGKTPAGWLNVTGKIFPRESWTVEDGCLKAFPTEDATMQDIRTVGLYRYFELEWEWKLGPLGNSGVKYLLGRTDEGTRESKSGRNSRARGFEYQLADDANPDALEKVRQCSSLYSAIAPNPKLPCQQGIFHRSRIVVRPGGRIEHWLDGRKVVEFSLDQPEVQEVAETNKAKPGQSGFADGHGSPIALQNHGTEAWFRNIRIRELADR